MQKRSKANDVSSHTKPTDHKRGDSTWDEEWFRRYRVSEKRRVDSYQKGMVVHIYSRSTWKDSREAWVIERNPISSKNTSKLPTARACGGSLPT